MKEGFYSISTIIQDARKDLEYAIAQTTLAYVLSQPNSTGYKNAMIRMAKSIILSYSRTSRPPESSPSKTVQNSTHYKWSQIMAGADSFKDVTENVALHIGPKRNIRELYTLAGFQWQPKNPQAVPPPFDQNKSTNRRRPNRSKHDIPDKAHGALTTSPHSSQTGHELEEFKENITKKVNELQQLLLEIKEALKRQESSVLKPHIHIMTVNGVRALTEETITITKIQ